MAMNRLDGRGLGIGGLLLGASTSTCGIKLKGHAPEKGAEQLGEAEIGALRLAAAVWSLQDEV